MNLFKLHKETDKEHGAYIMAIGLLRGNQYITNPADVLEEDDVEYKISRYLIANTLYDPNSEEFDNIVDAIMTRAYAEVFGCAGDFNFNQA